MKLFHTHRWEIVHLAYYQDNVRVIECQDKSCRKRRDRGVRGEHNQLIPWGCDATTHKTFFG